MQLSRPAPKSLLLVDASIGYTAAFVRAIRQQHPGTGVWVKGDGQSAIEYLTFCGTNHPAPDLVLLERCLPSDGPTGLDVLRAARALRHLAALPIVMLSTSDEEEHVVQATNAGASGFLVKPPEQGDYPQLVRDVLAWWHQKSWPELGPGAARRALATRAEALSCSPMAALTLDAPAALHPNDERSIGERLLEALGWMTRKAEEAVDPFQAALSRVCRAHRLTLVQLMGHGGSQSLVQARREAIVDLLAEKWPEETVLTVVTINERDMKRLRAAVRAKVGPKLARSSN